MEIRSCSKLYKINSIVVLNNTYSEPTRVTRRISARKNTGRNKATLRMAIFFRVRVFGANYFFIVGVPWETAISNFRVSSNLLRQYS